jgi:hypothetical protein
MKALQLIGQLFEVGAFLERKETTVVHKSSDIRTRLLERLGTVTDVKQKDDALTLLEEIRGDAVAKAPAPAPTGGVDAIADARAPASAPHTVLHNESPSKSEGGTHIENLEVVHDFDKQ